MPRNSQTEATANQFLFWNGMQHLRLLLVVLGLISGFLISERALAFRVDNPINGAVIYSVSGTLKVDTEFDNTELVSSMRFRALIDGSPVTPESYLPIFTLQDIAPGTYVLKVQIVDQKGKVMMTSDPVKFEMRRRTAP